MHEIKISAKGDIGAATLPIRSLRATEFRFTKAMEQMALNNAIGPYYNNTQEFVDELQNYLKISKVCDNEHLSECFDYDEIDNNSNKPVSINDDLKTGVGFAMNDVNYKDTVGIVTIDGTSMILSWKTDCPTLTPGVYEWGGDTNESTSCVAAVMDVNHDKGPNKLGRDVQLFNAKALGNKCAIRFDEDNICWMAPVPANKRMDLTNEEECNKFVEAGGNRNSCDIEKNQYANIDAWAYAVTYICGGTQNMPSREELAKLAKHVYKKTSPNYDKLTSISGVETTELELDISPNGAMDNLGLLKYYGKFSGTHGNYLDIWSNNVVPDNYIHAYILTLYKDRVIYNANSRTQTNKYALCLGEK